MDLRSLEYLEAVLATGSFTAAARRCHVAQPALWSQVRALERRFGIALFERVGRGVRPTPLAIALRPHWRILLGARASFEQAVDRVRAGRVATPKVGSTPYHTTHFLAEAIARYAARHPDAPLPEIVPVESADPYLPLREGEVELVAGLDPEPHGFEHAPLYSVWLTAVGVGVGPGDIELRSVVERPIVTLPKTSRSRELFDGTCLRLRLTPHVVAENADVPSLLALAARGLATAVVVNEALPEQLPARVHAARIVQRGRPLGGQLSLMWRDETTLGPAARALRDEMLELASERRVSATVRPKPAASRRRSQSARRGR